MAKTVVQGFEKLLDNLLITELQEDTVSTRHRNVRDAVKKRLVVLDDFLIGSYRRNTMIAPLEEADIDVFVVLDPQYYRKDGQAYILNKLRDVLTETYPSTPKISRDGQAVTITFSDFQVDVVPAFPRRILFWASGYYIADTISKQWIPTNPKEHIKIWIKANKDYKDDLIPLIKMIKCWNRENGSLLHSFHLECLILQILKYESISVFPSAVKYESISVFPSAVRFIFDKARSTVRDTISDPAGYNSNIGAYLNIQGKKDEVVKQLELAYGRAKNAEEWVRKGNIEDAYYYWGKIFGDYFPTY